MARVPQAINFNLRLVLGMLINTIVAASAAPEELPALHWRQLPPLPEPCGFASPFVGLANGALVIAGGANFPEAQLWEGGGKRWHDQVFVLRSGAASWTVPGFLPRKLAYGVAVTLDDGILCIGGSDATAHYKSAFVLGVQDHTVTVRDVPSLPKPLAMAAGARVGNTLYIAGGLEAPGSKEALAILYVLELDNMERGWRALPAWPGPGRFQPVAGAAGDYFYLFSGLTFDPKRGGALEYLRDAYRYSPAKGWERLPDLPFPAAAAASPAPHGDDNTLLVVSGVDGSGVGRSPQEFWLAPQRIQAFSTKSKSWQVVGNAPVGRVCVSTVQWNGQWILPTGERSAGIRSPEVWSVRFSEVRATPAQK